MPTYCFTCDKCGGYTEEHRTMADSSKPKQCECGETMRRCFQAEAGQHKPGNWPMYSDAVGVAASQVEEATREAADLGVPTDFTPDGRAIFTSASHRKRYCEALGFYDRNGGYSDPQRS